VVDRCREEIRLLRPQPPKPEPPPKSLEKYLESAPGTVLLSGPSFDASMTELTPESTKIVLVPLPGHPAPSPPFGNWFCLLDDFASASHGRLLREHGGFTLISADGVKKLELASLAATLKEADRVNAEFIAKFPRQEWPKELPRLGHSLARYAFEADPSGRPLPRVHGGSRTRTFSGRQIRAEELAGGIMRQRRIP
jgi:hypothetical protein